MTTAASVACGISPMRGARTSIVTSVAPAVTISASWVRAPARRLTAALGELPEAKVAAHPECPSEILEKSDFIGSTSAIIQWCAKSDARDIIVVTESGVARSLRHVAPGKNFHFIANEQCNCSECPYMKRNTLEKLRDSLLTLTPRVELSGDIIARALVPLERMLAVTAR